MNKYFNEVSLSGSENINPDIQIFTELSDKERCI